MILMCGAARKLSKRFKKLCYYGQFDEALASLDILDKQGIHITAADLYLYLDTCTRNKFLPAGRRIHQLIIKYGYESNAFLGTHLIHMFAACGSLTEANEIFGKFPNPTIFLWSAIIAAHAKLGESRQAIVLYGRFSESKLKPDAHTVLFVLKACCNLEALTQGKVIHMYILEVGLENDVFLCNMLIDMYAKCGVMKDAHMVFDCLPYRTTVSWNTLITGYACNGCGSEALHVFCHMQHSGVKLDKFTFTCALRACSDMAAYGNGILIHAQIMEINVTWDEFVASNLIDMYASCGSVMDAKSVFDGLHILDAVTWNAMIACHATHGYVQQAFQLFYQMQQCGERPDLVTFLSLINQDFSSDSQNQVKIVHTLVMESGLRTDAYIASALIDMYTKHRVLDDARRVFDSTHDQDVGTWNAMISGFLQHGLFENALKLYHHMQRDGPQPNHITFLCILKACAQMGAMDEAKIVCSHIFHSAFSSELSILNSIINLHVKFGHVKEARFLFDKLDKKDVITWNAIISGYAQHDPCQEALGLFMQMQQENIEPNSTTFPTILKVCATLAALDQGRIIHMQVNESCCESDVHVGNALVDMYYKCNSLDDACRVFSGMKKWDLATWNLMIAAYAEQQQSRTALQLFEAMKQTGVQPDDVTFGSILSVCNQEGLLDTGCYHFKLMSEMHRLSPTPEHLNCLTDLLGRTGHLEEAKDLLWSTPLPPNIVGWMSLLSNSGAYGKSDLARHCFDHVVEIDPMHGSPYVLLSSVYADMKENSKTASNLTCFKSGTYFSFEESAPTRVLVPSFQKH